VSFGYRTAIGDTSDRAVDAWAIVFRAGHWYLVGRDVDRDDVRAFRLSRVTSAIEDAGAGGEPPDGFRAADHVRGGPWTPQGEERATIAFTPDVAWLVEGSWSGAEVGATLPDGRVEVSVPLADERELASLVLAYGAGAEALAPPTLREEVVRRLEAFVA
jgi:predicted DNA-binding transcriptional regulator YafY